MKKYFSKKLMIYTIRENYNHLMQYAIKKGNKHKIEILFRNLLFYIAKNNFIKEKWFFTKILYALKYSTPTVGVKTKRKGSKNIYLPVFIKKNRSRYLASTWLIKHAKARSNKIFYKNLAEELLESSKKKSLSVKKCQELHKLAENNLSNIKEDLK